MSSEERITNLEVKLSFAEDLIENLNQTIYKQQQQIEYLYREMKSLKEQMSASGSEGLGGGSDARDLRDEIPPHY
jgi:SlyX protein